MVESSYAEQYVVAEIQDAVDGAYDFFEMQDIQFQREEYLQLINALSVKKMPRYINEFIKTRRLWML